MSGGLLDALKKKSVWQIVLFAFGGTSLVLTTTLNRWAGVWLERAASEYGWVASAAIPFCVGSLCWYAAMRPEQPFALPRATSDWPRIFCSSTVWLVIWFFVSIAVVVSNGGWVACTHGAAEIAAFLIFAPVGEELLFRGIFFELSERAFPGKLAAPIWISAVLFSLHHFETNHYVLTPSVLVQIGFTLPMGIIFARLCAWSGSVWAALVLHVLTNLPEAFGT